MKLSEHHSITFIRRLVSDITAADCIADARAGSLVISVSVFQFPFSAATEETRALMADGEEYEEVFDVRTLSDKLRSACGRAWWVLYGYPRRVRCCSSSSSLL